MNRDSPKEARILKDTFGPTGKIQNPLFFLAWCLTHIRCQDCQGLGAKHLRDNSWLCVHCLNSERYRWG